MNMRQSLHLRQTQSLVMTPQLRQAIQMLQMSTIELGAFLASEMERNPLIEIADGVQAAARPEPSAGERLAVDADMRRADLAAGEAQFATGRDNLYESAEAPPSLRGGAGGRADFETLDDDAPLVAPVTLAAHVTAQLALARLAAPVRVVAEALACELDEAGYLRVDPAEAAARLGAAPATVEAAAAAIRACEPTGVGARDLAECLALQLAERDRLDPAMRALLDNLADLPATPAAKMAARCGVDLADLADMLAEVRALDPRPGLAFSGGAAEPVIPDVLVSADGAGGWRVMMNPDATPRLLIDHSYAARVDGGGDQATRLYLSQCAQTATWLKKSLDQRARTIVTVAAEIVRAQARFFAQGVAGLRPMTLKAVAEAVGVHESTVSRVTANKFMATPRGLLEMKFFFTTAVGGGEGDATHSAQAVKARIRSLIAAEPPQKPLSDDDLVRALKAEGVEIARRTAAKYREALKIPSSVGRRSRARGAL